MTESNDQLDDLEAVGEPTWDPVWSSTCIYRSSGSASYRLSKDGEVFFRNNQGVWENNYGDVGCGPWTRMQVKNRVEPKTILEVREWCIQTNRVAVSACGNIRWRWDKDEFLWKESRWEENTWSGKRNWSAWVPCLLPCCTYEETKCIPFTGNWGVE